MRENEAMFQEYLQDHGVVFFKASEISQDTTYHGVRNTLVPIKYWDNMVKVCKLAQEIRQHFGKPVKINSGYRCKAYNKAISGAAVSQHMFGKALDIRINGVPPAKIAAWMDATYPHKYGRGLYHSFAHIDVREGYAKWKG